AMPLNEDAATLVRPNNTPVWFKGTGLVRSPIPSDIPPGETVEAILYGHHQAVIESVSVVCSGDLQGGCGRAASPTLRSAMASCDFSRLGRRRVHFRAAIVTWD